MSAAVGRAGLPAPAGVSLFDMHCHLDFAPDAPLLAGAMERRGIGGLSCTVTPQGYAAAAPLLAAFPRIRCGAGLHPWWVGEDSAASDLLPLLEAIGETPFVGEVGLDFGPRHEATRAVQLTVFSAVARRCAELGGKVLSIHAVRSAGLVLDVLEESGCLGRNACVLHWFSGSPEELARAVRLGCRFSMGPRMLATRRGRAYARAVPLERILLETDEPAEAGTPCDAEHLEELLSEALAAIACARDANGRATADDVAGLAVAVARASRDLLQAG